MAFTYSLVDVTKKTKVQRYSHTLERFIYWIIGYREIPMYWYELCIAVHQFNNLPPNTKIDIELQLGDTVVFVADPIPLTVIKCLNVNEYILACRQPLPEFRWEAEGEGFIAVRMFAENSKEPYQ